MKKILSLAAILATFFFVACDKKEEAPEGTEAMVKATEEAAADMEKDVEKAAKEIEKEVEKH